MNMHETINNNNNKVIRNNMRGLKSKNHEMFTYESNKISLCDFD